MIPCRFDITAVPNKNKLDFVTLLFMEVDNASRQSTRKIRLSDLFAPDLDRNE